MSEKEQVKKKTVTTTKKVATTKTTKPKAKPRVKKAVTKKLTLQEKIKTGNFKMLESYIPFLDQRTIVSSVANICIGKNEYSDIWECDPLLRDLMLKLSIVDEVTDLDISGYTYDEITNDDGETTYNINLDKACEIYDLIEENGVYENVHKDVKSVGVIGAYVESVVNMQLEQLNSLSHVVDRHLKVVVDSLTDFVENRLPDEKGLKSILDKLPQVLNKIDKNKMELLSKVLGQNKK